MKKIPRLRLIVPGGLQFRYLKFLFLSMAVPTLLVTACLYYLIISIVAQEIGFPEAIASALFPAMHRINILLAIGVPVVFLIILLIGLFFSHRLAGPVFRLEKELERIAKGDTSSRIKFRKTDEFAGVAQGINKVLEHIESLKK